MKIVLFGFDGLRPDCITSAVMPNLRKFLDDNVQCKNSRSVFPTETYVNHPSIFSGFLPERHGLVANVFYDSGASRTEPFVGSKVEKVEMIDTLTKGRLYTVPTLTDTLSQNGLSYISLSTNSPGSTRLIAHNAKKNNGINISTSGLQYAIPEEFASRWGSSPQYGSFSLPDIQGIRKLNTMVDDLFTTIGMADVNIIWYGEPDNVFHAHGIGSPQAQEGLREVDTLFFQIMKRWCADEEVQVMVLSDHGHVTVTHHFDIVAALAAKGFKASSNMEFNDGDAFTVVYGYSGLLYVGDTSLIAPLSQALMEMDEIGLVFTDDLDGVQGVIEGTFSKRLVASDHPRSGEIRYVLQNSLEKNEFGFPGCCYCPDFIKIGGSIHGGLNPYEVNSVLGFGGSAFKKHTVVEETTSVIDVTPTIYELLGIKPRMKVQGKVVTAALKNGEPRKDDVPQCFVASNKNGYSQSITIVYKDSIPYILHGERFS
ncbi:alkaline phosphatase family protein [uncultured Sphaerochaeta sp.]|uniref:alkaline phosphatase family protein n=1 Tax=uncultured Sphaerochaeta sp. TaxID=886478 RepID=UPI002A0A5EB6|nr:alkaline phosphatase family protein [uncultured Sphaerochaeta sp.]